MQVSCDVSDRHAFPDVSCDGPNYPSRYNHMTVVFVGLTAAIFHIIPLVQFFFLPTWPGKRWSAKETLNRRAHKRWQGHVRRLWRSTERAAKGPSFSILTNISMYAELSIHIIPAAKAYLQQSGEFAPVLHLRRSKRKKKSRNKWYARELEIAVVQHLRTKTTDFVCERITERFLPDAYGRTCASEYAGQEATSECQRELDSLRRHFNERVRLANAGCRNWCADALEWSEAAKKAKVITKDLTEAIKGTEALLYKSREYEECDIVESTPVGDYLLVHPSFEVLEAIESYGGLDAGQFLYTSAAGNLRKFPDTLLVAIHTRATVDPSTPLCRRDASRQYLSDAYGSNKVTHGSLGPLRVRKGPLGGIPSKRFPGKVPENLAFDCVTFRIGGWHTHDGNQFAVLVGPLLDLEMLHAIVYYIGQSGLNYTGQKVID